MTSSEVREIRILGLDQVLARMRVAEQRFKIHAVCERCKKQPSAIVRSARGAYEVVCRACSGRPAPARSSAPGSARGTASLDRELARIDQELAELDAKRRAEPPPKVRRSYSPGLAGVLERELDLLELSL